VEQAAGRKGRDEGKGQKVKIIRNEMNQLISLEKRDEGKRGKKQKKVVALGGGRGVKARLDLIQLTYANRGSGMKKIMHQGRGDENQES